MMDIYQDTGLDSDSDRMSVDVNYSIDAGLIPATCTNSQIPCVSAQQAETRVVAVQIQDALSDDEQAGECCPNR